MYVVSLGGGADAVSVGDCEIEGVVTEVVRNAQHAGVIRISGGECVGMGDRIPIEDPGDGAVIAHDIVEGGCGGDGSGCWAG